MNIFCKIKIHIAKYRYISIIDKYTALQKGMQWIIDSHVLNTRILINI